jgi:hypothetical protein
MCITRTLARGRLALTLALLLGGVALAGEGLREETRVLVRTTGGAIERLTLPELAPGETRTIATDSGNGALITRTAEGLRIEAAGEVFEVTLPDADAAETLAAGGVQLERELLLGDDGGADHDKRHVVVIRKRHIGDQHADPAAHRLDLLEEPALLLDGDDGKRIVVVRRVVRTDDA